MLVLGSAKPDVGALRGDEEAVLAIIVIGIWQASEERVPRVPYGWTVVATGQASSGKSPTFSG